MEQEFKILMNNVPAVLFKGYLDGSIDLYDKKVETLTGFSLDDFRSRSLKWIDLILAEDQDQTKETFIKALKTNKAYVREYRIKGRESNIIWIHERSHIVCDTDGTVNREKAQLSRFICPGSRKRKQLSQNPALTPSL